MRVGALYIYIYISGKGGVSGNAYLAGFRRSVPEIYISIYLSIYLAIHNIARTL